MVYFIFRILNLNIYICMIFGWDRSEFMLIRIMIAEGHVHIYYILGMLSMCYDNGNSTILK